MSLLNVYSVFKSLNGEVGIVPQGMPITFIRLHGCNLRCTYCDTPKSQDTCSGGEMMFIEDIVEKVAHFKCPNVLITGGEPLMQAEEGPAFGKLLRQLKGIGIETISIEANGTFSPFILRIDDRKFVDCFIYDYKLRGSDIDRDAVSMSITQYVRLLPDQTFIKFVCTDKLDFVEGMGVMIQIEKELFDFDPDKHFQYAFSATSVELSQELASWILEAGMHGVVLNLQIHKILFPQGEKGDEIGSGNHQERV